MRGIAVCAFAMMAPFLTNGAGPAGGPEDDLAVVKRAVAQSQDLPVADRQGQVTPPRVRKAEPQWLRIRVIDKGSKKGRVSVNLPLALVHALGDDWPVDLRCGHNKEKDRRCSLRLVEVLRSLEAGQELVEVDDEDSIVRVWVE